LFVSSKTGASIGTYGTYRAYGTSEKIVKILGGELGEKEEDYVRGTSPLLMKEVYEQIIKTFVFLG
jgi:hypothetical protein